MNCSKGLFYIDVQGYRRIKRAGHHRSDNKGYVKEHILFAEMQIGRRLLPGEIVHHTDLAKGQINPFGLVVCTSDSDHKALHSAARAVANTGNKDDRTCYYCKEWDSQSNLKKKRSGGYFHSKCHSEYNKKYSRGRRTVQ